MSLVGHIRRGVILLCLSLPANADDPSAVFNDAKAYAQGTVDGTGGIVGAEQAATLPHYTTTSPVPGLVPGSVGLGGAGAGKIQGCQGQNDTECAAVNFLAGNPNSRLRFNLDPATDPSLQAGKQVQANPNAVVGAGQDGSESVCSTRTVTDPATYTTEVCNEYRTTTTQTCERVLSVACDPLTDGCDAGGIVANSWAGDMAVNWAPSGTGDYNLTFGTIADNYWSGWGATFDRTLTFDIRDKSLITRFALTRAAFDDWLWVKVNDQTVYVGPRGGDRLYVIGQGSPVGGNAFCYQNDWSGQWSCYQYIGWSETPTLVGTYQYCATIGWDGSTWYCNNDGPPGYVKYGPAANDYGSPELSTSWNFSLNIDIKPYLKEGLNTVWMRTIVAGGGEGAVVFTTRQTCPRNCRDVWSNECAAFEARAQ